MRVPLNLHQKYFLLLQGMPVAVHIGVQSLGEHCDPREAGVRSKGLRTQDRDQCSKSKGGTAAGHLGRKILAESRAGRG